jgi:hypothetical protein
MLDRANTGMPIRQLARIGSSISDELVQGLNRYRRMYCNAEKIAGDARYRI